MATATAFAACAAPASQSVAHAAPGAAGHKHVLLLSVDGLHESDLQWYVTQHPRSALAALVRTGTEFSNAQTPFPSDSFPGMVGQLTGGNPRTTGIYYDVTYNHATIDPTASTAATPDPSVCASTPTGGNVAYDETIDKDNGHLDAGQGLGDLPSSILQMTGNPRNLIDATQLPIDPATCTRIYPHSYLKVNTVFEVAKAHGLRTAWSDKHPAYEILNGPSGTGLDDLFTPEINAPDADTAGHDWTQVNAYTQRYDHYKVEALLNEIAGKDHSGRNEVGMPAVFGMNFQTVSTAEKLPTSGGQPGGYSANGTIPGPVLAGALDFVDHEVASLVAALKADHHYGDTVVILSAKHGQSPTDGAALKRISDGPIVDGLNAAWQSAHPEAAQPLVAGSLNDDGMLLWFSNGDRTPQAAAFATAYLTAYNGTGTGTDGHARATDITTAPVAYTAAGLQQIHAGADAAAFIGTSENDPRVPDLIGVAQHGVVYTGGTKKIAEHGGDDPQDRHVPLLVSGPGIAHGVDTARVETTQIAPTILSLLGIDPSQLQAVQAEHTAALPVTP